MKRFPSPAEYKKALDGWIDRRSKLDKITTGRIKKVVVFDAFLARIARSTHGFVLRGGYAMEMRFSTGRSEGGLDLSVKERLGKLNGTPEMATYLKRRLEAVLSEDYERDDAYFDFRVEDADSDGSGGYRFPIRIELAGTAFDNFNLDVSVNDYLDTTVLRKESQATPSSWSEAGADSFYRIETISSEQHFSEKLLNYVDGGSPENQARNLVDLYLLSRSGMDDEELKMVLVQVSKHRQRKLPQVIPVISQKAAAIFAREASDVQLSVSMEDVHKSVRDFYTSVLTEIDET